ncbi:MAG: phage portal protein [Eggerthellaceae bacterium]|nr:phage portal protein [Eggerthellaceae bacterium]
MATIQIEGRVAAAEGLGPDEAETVRELVWTWRDNRAANELRDRYYLGKVKPKNSGISVRKSFRLDASCGWPRKAVDYIAMRSQFDGFTTADEDADALLRRFVAFNDVKYLYQTAVTSELTHCCVFGCVTQGGAFTDQQGQRRRDALVRFTPATASSGVFDDESQSISSALTVRACERKRGKTTPTVIDAYLPDEVLTLSLVGGSWAVTERRSMSMGRTLCEPLVNNPTLVHPFGHSLITPSVMALTDEYLAEFQRAALAAEFAAAPQKYLLNTDKSAIANTKYEAYIGEIFAVSKSKDGTVPVFGQLPQLSMEPHLGYVRSLAAQVSGETNVPLSALGIVHDNPSSAEAIAANKEDAVIQVQRLNAGNGRALVNIGWMALAIMRGTDFETERAAVPDLSARFRDPSMPSIVSQSDAMVKQISASDWIGETDVALEKLGYNDEEIQRMNAQKARSEAMAALQFAMVDDE